MIRILTLLLLVLPCAGAAAEHEIQLLDAAGTVSSTEFSAATSCGDCHDVEYLEPHGPHAVDTGADCFGCHVRGEVPVPDDGWVTVEIGAPSSSACGRCHGLVVEDPDEPFFAPPDPARPMTLETGAIFAPGRIPRSGMNVAARDSLARPWDVHAERLVGCADCHASATSAPPRCTDCHATEGTHDFLPDVDTHLARLACEACHVPGQYGTAIANVDATLIDPEGEPLRRYHGTTGDPSSPKTLVRGFRPVLLPRREEDGQTRLAPHNLVAEWAWYDGAEPVPRGTLELAFLSGSAFHPSVVRALDATGDGEISELEFGIYSPHQVDILASRLREVGVLAPEIRGEVRAVEVHHGVAPGSWATRECGTCHGEESALTAEFWLADYAPGGAVPAPTAGSMLAGSIATSECGHVVFHPDPAQGGFDLAGTGPGNGLGNFLRMALLIGVALVAFTFGTGPMLRTFRRPESGEDGK
jgi:hypothetical protein